MTFYEIIYLLPDISPVILTGGLVLGALRFKRLNTVQRTMMLYLGLMLGVDLLGRLLDHLYHNNLVVLPIFSLIEMCFFVYFYNRFLLSRSVFLIGLGIVGAVYITIETLQYFVFNTLDVKQFQPYSKVVDNFVIIVMALVFFYQKINNFNETKWDNFKLNTVLLIYFTFNTIVFLPFNFMINESSGVKFYFWIGNLVIMLLFYIYLISLVLGVNKDKRPLSAIK